MYMYMHVYACVSLQLVQVITHLSVYGIFVKGNKKFKNSLNLLVIQIQASILGYYLHACTTVVPVQFNCFGSSCINHTVF